MTTQATITNLFETLDSALTAFDAGAVVTVELENDAFDAFEDACADLEFANALAPMFSQAA